uniref:AAA family ATPase n=1 Tax=Parolsenella massiliensis TaxID=1871022 RepID=UPI0009320F5F|nr:AAA family ATPase [Parolsenella massiliensis]
MIRINEWLVYAALSLLNDRNPEQGEFSLKTVYFSESELLLEANRLNPERRRDLVSKDFKGLVFNEAESQGGDRFFVRGPSNMSLNYLRLASRSEADSAYLGVFSSFDLAEQGDRSFFLNGCPLDANGLSALLTSYSDFVEKQKRAGIPRQPHCNLSPQWSIYLAAASFALNEFLRTGSVDEASYWFIQKPIVAEAKQLYGRENTSFQVFISSAFADGSSAAYRSYFLRGSEFQMRRLSCRADETKDEKRPTDPLDDTQMILTFDGLVPIREVLEFVDNEYSSIMENGSLGSRTAFHFTSPGADEGSEMSDEESLGASLRTTPTPEESAQAGNYDDASFLGEVYMTAPELAAMRRLLFRKKCLVLQGPPGVGKTFSATRLAYNILGSRDPSRVTMIQMHQNYSYEEFIEGYCPTENGFALKDGVLLRTCDAAREEPDRPFFLIIDEMNRGNMSRVFGESFLLLEVDKRDFEITLPYSGRRFSVPGNLFVIGLMNTADRNLAFLDFAFRRRFAFFDMRPGFDSPGFSAYAKQLGVWFERLVATAKRLNDDILQDESLGRGFQIGHSFFCGLNAANAMDQMRDVIQFEITPLLREYWFDDAERAELWISELMGSLQ